MQTIGSSLTSIPLWVSAICLPLFGFMVDKIKRTPYISESLKADSPLPLLFFFPLFFFPTGVLIMHNPTNQPCNMGEKKNPQS